MPIPEDCPPVLEMLGTAVPPGATDLVIPKLFTRSILDMLPPAPVIPVPRGFAASLEPDDVAGESTSILSIALTLLLWSLCLLGGTATLDRELADAVAPGPGVALGGAAAMGTTPLPPLTAVVPTDDPAEPW